MTAGSRRVLLSEGLDPRSTLYWLDIDVNFNEIVRQERMTPSNLVVRRPRSSLQYSVLHGVGTVANALSVGEKGTTFHRFEVVVAALVQTDENIAPADLHRSARMIWNEVDVHAPRLEISVQTKMLRHLVELYVTKRIDTVTMSMKIAVVLETIVETSHGAELLLRFSTETGIFTSDAPTANFCRCTPRWRASALAGSPSRLGPRPKRRPVELSRGSIRQRSTVFCLEVCGFLPGSLMRKPIEGEGADRGPRGVSGA